MRPSPTEHSCVPVCVRATATLPHLGMSNRDRLSSAWSPLKGFHHQENIGRMRHTCMCILRKRMHNTCWGFSKKHASVRRPWITHTHRWQTLICHTCAQLHQNNWLQISASCSGAAFAQQGIPLVALSREDSEPEAVTYVSARTRCIKLFAWWLPRVLKAWRGIQAKKDLS